MLHLHMAVRKDADDSLRALHKGFRLLDDHLNAAAAAASGPKSSFLSNAPADPNSNSNGDANAAPPVRPYLVGNTLTLADIFTVSVAQFGYMVFHKVIKEDYAAVGEWFERIWEEGGLKGVAGELHLLDMPVPRLEDLEGKGKGENGVNGH